MISKMTLRSLAALAAGVLLFAASFSASAQPALRHESEIPEKNGDYADPGHPGVRVRVFVHAPKAPLVTTSAQCLDPDSTAVVGAAGWHLPDSVTYRVNTSSAPASVGASNFPTLTAGAFSEWANALPASISKPTFVVGPTTLLTRSAYDKQNIIAWGRTSGRALGVTYVRYFTASGLIVDVDTILNRKFPWSWSGNSALTCGDPSAYDAQNILTHEIGHWIGLDDEYTSAHADNTMYGYGSTGEVKKDTVTTGDKQNLGIIYP